MDRTQLAIELVHGIDALEAERARLVAPLDEKIKKAREDLATMMRGLTPRVTRPSNRSRGTGKKLCELLVETPDAPPGIRAMQLYGEDTAENRKKLRSLFNSLSHTGLIRRAASGQWEVVPKQT